MINKQKTWIWQHPAWPIFSFQAEVILPELEKTIRIISPLNLLASELNTDKQLTLESQILLNEAMSSAKIEGEMLDRESVRSSIAKRMGIGRMRRSSRAAEAFIDVLLTSIRSCDSPLTESLLHNWHGVMFYEKPVLDDILIGKYRNDSMQILSGHYGKHKIHFQAPCNNQSCVKKEMTQFLNWINTESQMPDIIKAAIAKFWFVTIHPFDDGNGRLSRIIAERVLMQNEVNPIRLYSISHEIEKNRNDYYKLLEKTQSTPYKNADTIDLSEWIIWFLQRVTDAATTSMKHLDKIRFSTGFWDKHHHTVLNKRQKKLISRLLETDDFEPAGISRRKYKSMAHTTDITAARDLKDLVEKKLLIPSGEGRSRKYQLKS